MSLPPILGISHGHGDSSAALVVNGKLVAAVEEERFTRVKHYALFPELAIQYCLRHAGLQPSDIGIVALPKKPGNGVWHKAKQVILHPTLLTRKKLQRDSRILTLEESLEKAGLLHCQRVNIEHHLAHMMSARFLGPEEETAYLSFDGLGDFVSTAFGRSTPGGVEIFERLYFPHSLGHFYNAMTQFLGFPYFGDEFKVMGLSSYGKPTFLRELSELVSETPGFGFSLNLKAFPVVANAKSFRLDGAQPTILPFYNQRLLENLLKMPARGKSALTQQHSDLAKSVQVRFEQIANHLLSQLHDAVGTPNLALSGGCSHNSVWVGKIPQNSPFRNIHVAPASHDAGLSVGAALGASNEAITPEGGNWALLGPSHLEGQTTPTPAGLSQISLSENELFSFLSKQLAQGKIIGLFHGRMEFGPRALGSRSILCDPREEGMRHKLNARVKHREKFRPFAASVLWEHQPAWFRNSFFSPAMEAVFEVEPSKAKEIGAVTHVDGTCRIQSITATQNPFFWKLIEAFRKETGIPMLLNTSFNDCEPIVCTEKDAFHCFENCEMDYLVLGTRVFERNRESKSARA